MSEARLTRVDVEAAYDRIQERVTRTPVMRSRQIDASVGAEVFFKCEHLQSAGAFKFRGASHAISLLTEEQRALGVITHSSGNHAQALALAARRAAISATIVMPRGSNPLKRAATQAYGASIIECENTQQARETTCADEMARGGQVMVHPYNDRRIIAGAGTAALELLEQVAHLDAIVTPVGGGGLLSGSALAAADQCVVYGAEPRGADDAYRSLQSGVRVTEQTPETVADGLRTCLGELNFAIIARHVHAIGLASDDEILAAMALVHTRMKQLIEPSSAVPLACLLNGTIPASGRIGVILSGGNLDPSSLSKLDDRVATER